MLANLQCRDACVRPTLVRCHDGPVPAAQAGGGGQRAPPRSPPADIGVGRFQAYEEETDPVHVHPYDWPEETWYEEPGVKLFWCAWPDVQG